MMHRQSRELRAQRCFLRQPKGQTFSVPAQDGLPGSPSGCGFRQAAPPERCSIGGRPRVHGDGVGCWLAEGRASAVGIP